MAFKDVFKKKAPVWGSVLGLGLVGTSCDDWHVWDDLFARQPATTAHAWMGGDGAVSAPLAGDKTVWIFGDTWLGGYDASSGDRVNLGFLAGNSIGVLSTSSSPAPGNMAFYGRSGATATNVTTSSTGAITQFFDYSMFTGLTKPDSTHLHGFWPAGAACLDCADSSTANDRLLVSFTEMQKCTSSDPACIPGFGLKPTSNVLAIINNPNDAPTSWHVTSADPAPVQIPTSKTDIVWGQTFLVDGSTIYVYGSEIAGAVNLYVARTTRANILAPSSWEYCIRTTASNCFTTLAAPPHASGLKVVADGVGTLGTVTKITRRNLTKYVLVHDRPGQNHYVDIRMSDSPTGWAAVTRNTPKVDLTPIDSTLSGEVAIELYQGKCTTVASCALNNHSRAQPHISLSDSNGLSSLYFSYIIPVSNDPNDARYYRPKFGSIPLDNLAPWCTPAGQHCWTGVGAMYIDSVGTGASNYYNFDVSQKGAGDTIQVQLSGGSGDPDLYVRFDNIPTTSTFDCRSFVVGTNEYCSLPIPSGASVAEVMVYGYSSGSYTLSASYPGN